MKSGLLPIEPVEIGMPKILDGQYAHVPRAHEVLEFGLYGKQLNHYSDFFSRENFCVVLLEDMKHDAESQLASLYYFLGVAQGFHPASFGSRPMMSPYSITRLKLLDFFARHCRTWSGDGKYFERKSGTIATSLTAFNSILDQYVWERLFPASRPKLSPALHDKLTDYYRDDVKCLERWLGRTLTDWSDFVG
jgi:hypothetical protein